MKTFKFGKVYRIKDPDPDEYGQYIYVTPVEYADGAWLGDCWIVDARGNVHPGYNVSPVPFHRDSVTEVRR
jgi:hypothetical protein